MKPRTLLLILFVAVLMMTSPSETAPMSDSMTVLESVMMTQNPLGQHLTAQASGSGNEFTATQYMSRVLTDQSLSIANTFANPDHHNGTLDLSSYLIPGWTLYKVISETKNITATAEKEVVGVTHSDSATENFRIYEAISDIYVLQLAQSFYYQPHNGSLLNYSIRYRTTQYDPVYQQYAYSVIRSDNEVRSTNITQQVNLTSTTPYIWKTIDGNEANLNLNTHYWAIIDGEYLQKYLSDYPIIRWSSENGAGSYDTALYLSTWQYDRANEALMNYTYIPWNKTSISALTFQPDEIDLRANSSSLSGTEWEWTGTNITSLSFDSNQSVSLNYNLTLWYERDTVSSTTWDVQTSGNLVDWNLTTTISYPDSGTSYHLNLTRMSDWTPTGLYNGTSTVDHDNYLTSGTTITCSSMTNGTWTMTFSADNYLAEIQSNDVVSILDTMTITSVVQDDSLNPATTGSTNLTVWREASVIGNPANQTVVAGETDHLWDISEDTSLNGTYRQEVYWTNGTEAGYLTKEIVVYYPTTLTPAETLVHGFTDDTVRVVVEFVNDFDSQGLNDTSSDILYSFDGGAYAPMIDPTGNGTWYADIDTTGKNAGSYLVQVNASGFAIENQTTQITLELLHDTNPLELEWSNTGTITYLESTTLKVNYTKVDGTPVTGATVNVTIGTDWWLALWNIGSETYDITFNGTDAIPGLGTHSVNVNASLTGYVSRIASDSLTIEKEPTAVLGIEWYTSNNITYVGQTILRVQYNLTDGTPVTTATVIATIDTDVFTLSWKGTSGYYEYIFDGTADPPGFGVGMTVTINATLYGYVSKQDTTTLTIREEPTGIIVSWTLPHGNNITYVEYTVLRVNYTMSNGTTITQATVEVTNGTEIWSLHWNGTSGFYEIQFNGTDANPGFGTHSLTVTAMKIGYQTQTPPSETLYVREEPTSLTANWLTITFEWTESVYLSFNYTDSDGDFIIGATQRQVFIESVEYTLTDAGNGTYYILLDNSFELGYHDVYANLSLYGYEFSYLGGIDFTITESPNMFDTVWNPFDRNITYAEEIQIRVTYNFASSPILGATVRLYLNTTTVYDFTYVPLDAQWLLVLRGDEITLGTFNATVVANMTGYDTGREETLLFVIEDSTVTTASWSTMTIEYVDAVRYRITFEMSNGTVIQDGVVAITLNGSAQSLQQYGNGTYFIDILSKQNLGLYWINTTFSRLGFTSVAASSNLTVSEAQTQLLVTPSDETPYYDESVGIVIRFQLLDTTVISDVNVTFEVDGVNQTIVWAIDHWELDLIADELGVGVHPCFANFSAYGYEMQTLSFDITVLEIPTDLEITGNGLLYVNDSLTLTVRYLDTRNNSTMPVPSNPAGWSGSTDWSDNGDGSYTLVLNSTGIHAGNYDVAFNINVLGNALVDEALSVVVSPVITEIVTSSTVNVYENEMLLLQISFNDTFHASAIHWANISVELDDNIYWMQYDQDLRMYTLSIWMDYEVFTDQIYLLSIEANATDCVSDSVTVTLTVIPKIQYMLAVEASERVVAGSELSATVSVTISGTPQRSVDVKVFFRLTINETSSVLERMVTTNNEGFGTVAITIPEGTTSVEIWAEIPGAENVWFVISSVVVVDVDPTPDLLSLIIRYMTSPLGIIVLLFLGIIASSSFYYRKKVTPRKHATLSSLQSQLRMFEDLKAIQHFMAVYLNRGTCVFYHPFGESRIQADLISGFIAAVTSVYGEIKGDGVQGTLEEIQYQGLRLNSYSGRFVLGILILEMEISQKLRDRLQFFIEMFENEYENYLDGWTGITDCFDPEWIVSNFVSAFNYGWALPQTVHSDVKMTGGEKKILKYIQASMGDRREFYIEEYLDGIAKNLGKSRAYTLEILLRMQEKGIIRPISVSTFLVRQGLGLPGEEEEYTEFMEEIPEEEKALDDVLTEEDTPLKKEADEVLEEALDVPEATESEEKIPEEPVKPEEEKKTIDPKEDFVKEVESLLKKDKKKKDKK